MTEAQRRLRIAQVAPPVERVPPAAYGGTERVVHELTQQLVERGHDVTLFASGDSVSSAKLLPTVDRALRPAGVESDAGGWFATTVKMVVDQANDFDVIHSHLEWWSIPLARLAPVPVAATFHGRLDLPWADRLLRDAPDGMVAISRHQASTHPDVPWTIIHNGLTLDRAPFVEEPGDAFCFVGRVDAEKGIIEAIDIALRAGRRLRIAAKVGNLARQRDYYEGVFRPALQRAGRSIEYLGELQPAERDQLFAESYATLMPGAWPEPFGLVSIESLACGTPVLARRVGALPEIIREGVDGFFGDDAVAMAFFADRLGGLDRREIRERVIERFSAARMTDRYEELYLRLVEARESAAVPERTPDALEVEQVLAVEMPSEVAEPADARLPGVPDVTDTVAGSDETTPELEVAGSNGTGATEAHLADAHLADAHLADAHLAQAKIDEAIEGMIDSAPEPVLGDGPDESPEPALAAVIEALAEPQAEPEATAAEIEDEATVAREPMADWAPELAGEPSAESEAIAEAEPASVAAEQAEPGLEAERDSEAESQAEAEAEAEPEGEAEPEPEPEAQPEPVLVVAGVREVGAEESAEAEPASESTSPVAAMIERITSEAPPSSAGPEPIAVEVELAVQPPEEPGGDQSSPARAAAPPARPAIAVGPGRATERGQSRPTVPAPPASTPPQATPATPAPKPPAKRPSRKIGIFTRQWSGSSGRATSGRRRHPS